MENDDLELRLRTAERAVSLAHQVGDDRLLLNAEITRADALWDAGREDDALAVVQEAIQRAEAGDDLGTLARALGNTGVYYARRGDLSKDREYHQRALEVSERRGDRAQSLLASMVLSMNAFLAGDWDDAERYVERAERIIEGSGEAALRTWPVSARGWLALRKGNLKEARGYAEEALPLAHSDGDWYRLVHRLLSEIELMRGSPADALGWLEPLLEEPGWKRDGAFLASLAWAYMENGRLQEADETARHAVEETRRVRDQSDLAFALTIRGAVASRLQRWDAAEEAFGEALSFARSVPLPFEEARALSARACMLAQRGEAQPAAELFGKAAETFRGLGAELDAVASEARAQSPAPAG
jgi:tetratricopeptide (TPR) repeat protein